MFDEHDVEDSIRKNYKIIPNTNIISQINPPYFFNKANDNIHNCLNQCSQDKHCSSILYYKTDDTCFYQSGIIDKSNSFVDHSLIQPILYSKN